MLNLSGGCIYAQWIDLKPSKDLSSAVTSDVRMFLVYKEKNGKTIVHNTGCKFHNG
jgi:hypothetical protein